RGRVAKAHRACEEVQREARVDDVFDDEHVAAADVGVEVLQQPHGRVTAGRRAGVARELDEIELVRDAGRSRQVGEEDNAGLERCDEPRLQPLEVARDVTPELRDARGDLKGGEKDLADARRGRYETSFRPYRWARRSISRR